jgi:hypothetical protein
VADEDEEQMTARAGNLISDYRVYVDAAPVRAEVYN